MEKHNKVLLLGDIHIGDINFTLENELVQLLNSDEFDCIVIGGDTFDPWRGESIAELMFSHRKLFEVLKHKNVIFLRGNHDNDLEELEKSGFTVRAFYEYLTSNNKKVRASYCFKVFKIMVWIRPSNYMACFEKKTLYLL